MSSAAPLPAQQPGPADRSIFARCRAGELVVLENFARRSGLHVTVRRAIDAALAAVTGPQAVQPPHCARLEQLHRLVDAGQLLRLVQNAERRLYRMAPHICRQALADGLGINQPVYLARKPLLRIQAPYEHSRALASGSSGHGYIDGRLTALRPHRDSWYSEPPDCISIWIALTDIVPGNGMSFYPDTDGKDLLYQPFAGVDLREALGAPRNIRMAAGDALLFSTELLHASELNRTQQSRVVLSLRISAARAPTLTREPWRYLRLHPGRALSRLRLHPAWSEVSRRACAAGHMLARRAGAARPQPPAGATPASGLAPAAAMDEAQLRRQLQAGRPLAVSSTHCVALDGAGRMLRFRRRCPHQGADLALGRVVDGQVICPWHNLPFDLASGRAACAGLPGLKPVLYDPADQPA